MNKFRSGWRRSDADSASRLIPGDRAIGENSEVGRDTSMDLLPRDSSSCNRVYGRGPSPRDRAVNI